MKRLEVFGIAAAAFLVSAAGESGVLGRAAYGQTAPATAVAPATGEGVSLRAKWVKGDSAQFDVTMESRAKSGQEGREEATQSQRLWQEVRVTRRVLDASEQGATLSLVYDRVQMQVFAEKSILKFDSASPAAEDEGNDLAPLVRPAVGLPLTVKVDGDGNVVSIEGNEEPEAKTHEDLEKARMARSLVGDDIISKVLRPLYGLTNAPARVKVGDTWTSEDVNDRPPIGVLTVDATHTVKSITDEVASVATTGTVRLSRAVGTMAVRADMSSYEIKGVAEWDAKKGSVKLYDSEQRVVLAIADAAGGKRTRDTVARITIVPAGAPRPKSEKEAAKPAAPKPEGAKP